MRWSTAKSKTKIQKLKKLSKHNLIGFQFSTTYSSEILFYLENKNILLKESPVKNLIFRYLRFCLVFVSISFPLLTYC